MPIRNQTSQHGRLAKNMAVERLFHEVLFPQSQRTETLVPDQGSKLKRDMVKQITKKIKPK